MIVQLNFSNHLQLKEQNKFVNKIPFPNEEMRDMLEMYYESQTNVHVTAEAYLQWHPEIQQNT